VLSGHDYSLVHFGVIEAVNKILGSENVAILMDDTWLFFKEK
jgi:hypothetical protein